MRFKRRGTIGGAATAGEAKLPVVDPLKVDISRFGQQTRRSLRRLVSFTTTRPRNWFVTPASEGN
jgi:hypothetical protein